MNVNAHSPGSRKTAPPRFHSPANGSETPASIGDWAVDAGSRGSQRDFAISAPAGTQRDGLINAACKVFFIKRCLDPEVDCGQHENCVRV